MPTKYDPYAAESATIEEAVPEYSMPRGTYAAPSLADGDAYIDEFGWAPDLKTSASGNTTPSAQRLGVIPRFDEYPDATRPPEEFYNRRGYDANVRDASQTHTQGVPWAEGKGVLASDHRWAPNPRSVPPPESRITQQLSPGTYSFTRPFDQLNRPYGDVVAGSSRSFNGWHFSMADHKRTSQITDQTVGSMPVRHARNTYRIEPTPWDTNIVDLPATVGPSIPTELYRTSEVPPNRSYRLM